MAELVMQRRTAAREHRLHPQIRATGSESESVIRINAKLARLAEASPSCSKPPEVTVTSPGLMPANQSTNTPLAHSEPADEMSPAGESVWRKSLLPVALTILALALWAASLPRIDPAQLDDFGLISILPWTAWASLAALAVAFSLSLRPTLANGLLPGFPLAALVLLLHATPAISYGTLRYSWAWKHIGIVDFIQRHDAVDPLSPFLAVYHNWPGFFVASALLADLFSLDPIALSQVVRFTPTVLSLLYLCALPPIFRQLTDDPRLVWTAVWIFLVGNWVGQDYFSPQGTAFLSYLLILGLCLGPLASRAAAQRQDGVFAVATQWFGRLVSRGLPERPSRLGAAGRMACTAIALLLIIAVVATHQLTPVILIFSLAGLAAIGRVSTAFVLFAGLMEVLWLLYVASPFVGDKATGILAELGNTAPEILGRLTEAEAISPGQMWVSFVCRALTVGIGAAAVLGGLRRLLVGFRDGPAIVLTVAPVALLVVTSYGGEIMFRVYMFALPFLSFFAAALFFPKPSSGHGKVPRALLCSLTILLAVGFVIANNGKDRQYRFTPSEIEAAKWLYENAPPDTLLVEGARNYPSQFMNYENLAYVPISEEDAAARAEIVGNPVEVLGRWLDNPRWKAGYVIITRSQKAYIDDLGVMPKGSLDRIEEALLASSRFNLVKATADVGIYALNPATRGMKAWER